MAELITKDQVIDWFRCYGHMDKPIPYDVLVTDIQAMDTVDAANFQQNDNCAAIAQQWIPVSERLPEKNDQWVLCLCVSGAIEVLKFDYTMWNWDAQYPGRCYMENYVTHWMPLPQLPKEVPENETL